MRLAQITDLHARWHLPASAVQNKRESRKAFELLPLALERIAAWKPDLLVLTGDLLDVPLCFLYPSDYFQDPLEAWLPLIRQDYLKLKDMLDASGLHYTVLPGNHDYEPVFWEVFDAEPRCFDCAGHRIYRFYDREWYKSIPHRIDRERRLFDVAMADKTALPQVHLQHYPVAPAIEADYPYNYFEADELRQRCATRHGPVLSLAGHYHEGSDLYSEGAAHFAVGAVFGQMPFTYSLYELGEAVTMERRSLLDLPPYHDTPVVFVGRDGVLDQPGAGARILALKQAGYAVVMLCNAPDVGGGYRTWKDQYTEHEALCHALVQEAGGDVRAQPDHLYVDESSEQPVHPQFADRSEALPSPVLLSRALERHGFRREGSYVLAADPGLRAAGEALGLPVEWVG